jgi:hypothetical protein
MGARAHVGDQRLGIASGLLAGRGAVHRGRLAERDPNRNGLDPNRECRLSSRFRWIGGMG